MRVVVIGVGNPYRHDDGVGPHVVERLRQRGFAGAELAATLGETTELIDLWDGADLAIVIDAVKATPPHPGRVRRLSMVNPPAERSRAAHGLDLGEAVELARVLGRLPASSTRSSEVEHGARHPHVRPGEELPRHGRAARHRP